MRPQCNRPGLTNPLQSAINRAVVRSPEPWWHGVHRPWLVGAKLVRRRWARPSSDSTYDHDHCQICSAKFSDAIEGAEREGYTTGDYAVWVCSDCFSNPSIRLHFGLSDDTWQPVVKRCISRTIMGA